MSNLKDKEKVIKKKLKLETFKNFLFKTVWAELILGVFV
jgi:hypothetical protein